MRSRSATARAVRLVGVTLVLLGTFAWALPRAAGRERDDAEEVLATAHQAATRWDFEADVVVEWSDGGDSGHVVVPVRVVDGVVEIEGDRTVVGSDEGRYVEDGGAWTTLWSATATEARPAPSRKYDLAVEPGRLVAGRTTSIVLATHGGVVRERLFVDEETGLILRREQYGEGSRPERTVTFRHVELVAEPAPLDAAPRSGRTDHGREEGPHEAHDVDGALPAPESAGDGWVLVGSYELDDGTVQRYYTDGVFSISLFQQRGELDWDALPAGTAVELAGHDARRWVGPAGEMHVWEMDGVVYTAVSDAPVGELGGVVDDLGHGDEGLFGRVASFVLSPFSLL